MESLLEMKNIDYSYPGEYENKESALKNINLTVKKGEKIAIFGGNGAGKSTLFLCANGVLRPGGGEIYLMGSPIGKSKSDINKLRKNVGLVFQDPDNQIIGTTVEGEISFGPMNLGLPLEEVKSRVGKAVSSMKLSGYEKRATHMLSGGEKKRLSIAGIVAMEPEVILFDEPTASLDKEGLDCLRETLAMLSEKGVTIMISTHDTDFAWEWADRGILLNKGEIIADGLIDEVLGNGELLDKACVERSTLLELGKKLYPHRDVSELPRRILDFEGE